MRFLLRFVLILLTAWLLQSVFPFWAAAVAAFGIGLLLSQRRRKRLYGKNTPPARAFLAGFLAIFLLWAVNAYRIDLANGSLLSQDVFKLLLQDANSLQYPAYFMILLTGCVGGLLGGFSAMTGNLLGEAIQG